MVFVGMDYGRARTGIAIILEGVVLPQDPVRGGWKSIEERLDALSERWGDITVVLGLPLGASGQVTQLSTEVTALAERLRKRGLKVVLQRETGTTLEALETCPELRRIGSVDSMAACLILKRYLLEP
jgi:putative Holliday junction resolvase